ncbi:MAG: hypothetical protein M3O70_07995, partial [Actinomycetota bacterium]|nr:hypothetical protein [Actinomycetota bacterium]
LCDVDRSSIEDLHGWSDRLDLNEQVHIVAADGMSMIDAHFASPMPPHRSLVHIDPFDPHHKQSGGRSAVELAGELVSAGVGLLYWYGYDDPKSRAWPLADLIDHDARSLWCGDILIVDETGGTVTGGDLGAATTPGTGFGVVAANVSDRAIRLCTDLGQALAATYRDSTLPNGSRGHIDFLHVASSD